MSLNPSRSIVFITGAFIGNNCWDEWKLYFESKGYKCIAPAWPNKYANPEELRNMHPDAAIASNRFADLAEYFATILKAMPGQPVIIGHAIGGLVVQLLLDRGLGSAGVVIHSFPPQGVCSLRFSFVKALWDTLAFFTSIKKSYMLSFIKWKYVFANGMNYEKQKQLFYEYAIPESKLLIRNAIKCNIHIDFEKPHAPLLFLAGSDDMIIHATLNYNNYKKYKVKDSIADYKLFNGRNHLFFAHPEWEEEAGFILHWLQEMK